MLQYKKINILLKFFIVEANKINSHLNFKMWLGFKLTFFARSVKFYCESHNFKKGLSTLWLSLILIDVILHVHLHIEYKNQLLVLFERQK